MLFVPLLHIDAYFSNFSLFYLIKTVFIILYFIYIIIIHINVLLLCCSFLLAVTKEFSNLYIILKYEKKAYLRCDFLIQRLCNLS